MKKLIGIAMVLTMAMTLFAAQAAAHGNCTPYANKPQKVAGQNQIKYAGGATCGESHQIADFTLRLYSRPGGSSGTDWSLIAERSFQQGPGSIFAGSATYNSYNCNKDYRVGTVLAGASPGAHVGTASSAILQNTC